MSIGCLHFLMSLMSFKVVLQFLLYKSCITSVQFFPEYSFDLIPSEFDRGAAPVEVGLTCTPPLTNRQKISQLYTHYDSEWLLFLERKLTIANQTKDSQLFKMQLFLTSLKDFLLIKVIYVHKNNSMRAYTIVLIIVFSELQCYEWCLNFPFGFHSHRIFL